MQAEEVRGQQAEDRGRILGSKVRALAHK